MNDDMAIAPKAGDGKLYKLVQLIAISVLIIAIVLVIFEVFQLLEMGTTANGIIFSIGVIGAGGLVALPWVRVLESFNEKPYRITAIVFLAVVGVCIILWIVCVWQIIGLVENGLEGATDEMLEGVLDSLNVIRISLIISLQFIAASYIAKNIIKYGKTLLPYQVMAGASQLYIDFYLVLILTAMTITVDGSVWFSDSAILLTNMWVHALLFIFIVLSIFPNVVFKRTDKRNLLDARNSSQNNSVVQYDNATRVAVVNNNVNNANADNADSAPIDEKLRKLKDLLDKGLITQEEYDKKREDILNSI